MPIPMTPALVADLERSERQAWEMFYRNASPAAITACGMGVKGFGLAVALSMSKIDHVAFNRVIGLGLEGPPDRKTVEGIIANYEEAMIPRFFIQLAPLVTLGPTADVVTGLGFAKSDNWVRLVRDVTPPGPSPTDFRIEEVDETRAEAFAAVICTGFGMPPEVGLPTASVVGTPGWHCYLAYEGETPVAGAAMVVEGRIAWFGFAATVPAARGRGAQSSLIARRILDAKTAGCEFCAVETDEQRPDKESRSYRNVLRAGFELAYTRPNYLYRFQQRDNS